MEVAEIFHTSAIWPPSFFTLCRICKGILTLFFALVVFHFFLVLPLPVYFLVCTVPFFYFWLIFFSVELRVFHFDLSI
jgi:hypothetical protein